MIFGTNLQKLFVSFQVRFNILRQTFVGRLNDFFNSFILWLFVGVFLTTGFLLLKKDLFFNDFFQRLNHRNFFDIVFKPVFILLFLYSRWTKFCECAVNEICLVVLWMWNVFFKRYISYYEIWKIWVFVFNSS